MATILVVDDHAVGRSLLARLLRLEGHRPLLAENVWQAMGILQSQDVDLVVLDFNLPGMDGDALLAQLSKEARFRRLPVIMVTAQQFDEQIFEQHKANLRDWMTKGEYDADELIASIEFNLGRSEERAAVSAAQ
jgi:DNA-binding response OmpR family regulator